MLRSSPNLRLYDTNGVRGLGLILIWPALTLFPLIRWPLGSRFLRPGRAVLNGALLAILALVILIVLAIADIDDLPLDQDYEYFLYYAAALILITWARRASLAVQQRSGNVIPEAEGGYSFVARCMPGSAAPIEKVIVPVAIGFIGWRLTQGVSMALGGWLITCAVSYCLTARQEFRGVSRQDLTDDDESSRHSIFADGPDDDEPENSTPRPASAFFQQILRLLGEFRDRAAAMRHRPQIEVLPPDMPLPRVSDVRYGILSRIARRRRKVAAIWLIVAVLGYCKILEFTASHGPLGYMQDVAVHYLARSEEKAGLAFAAARSINAAVSALKSANIGVILFNIQPMEVLEPLDDLAKQFSDVMVVSIAAILIQQTLLVVAQAWALTIALPIGALLLCVAAVIRSMTLSLRLSTIGRSIVILAIFARLSVPVTGWVGEKLTEGFLDSGMSSNVATITASADSLMKMRVHAAQGAEEKPTQPFTSAQPKPMFQTLLDTVTGAQESISRGMAYAYSMLPNEATIRDFLENLPTSIVRLIAVFLLQTILTPFLVTFFLYNLTRMLVRPMQYEVAPASHRIEFTPPKVDREDED